MTEPLFIIKAARQLGIPLRTSFLPSTCCQGRPVVEIPEEVSAEDRARLMERAEFLAVREAQGLPTELTPSGRMPEDHDEVDDPVAFRIGIDRARKVIAIHHGRPLKAFDIHPAAARALALVLMQAADEVDPEGASLREDPKLVGVAYVHAENGKVREASLLFNDPTNIPELKDEDKG